LAVPRALSPGFCPLGPVPALSPGPVPVSARCSPGTSCLPPLPDGSGGRPAGTGPDRPLRFRDLL